jgi:hypothetical protein
MTFIFYLKQVDPAVASLGKKRNEANLNYEVLSVWLFPWGGVEGKMRGIALFCAWFQE